MLNCSLGADATEYGWDIRDCTDLGFLVAVFAWNYRLFIREFLREDHLEAFLDAHVAEALADDVGQRAVEGLRHVGYADFCRIVFSTRPHRGNERNSVVHAVFDQVELR